MYVAHSEPARWCWGGGRADVTRRGLISDAPNRHEAGRDMGRWCVLPREALLFSRRRLPATTANRLEEETPKREGTEGGRFTDSTNDSGPMKRWQQRGGENPDDQEEGNRFPRPDSLKRVMEREEAVDER